MYSRDISDLYAAAERNKLDQSVELMNESRSKSNNRAKKKFFIQASQEMPVSFTIVKKEEMTKLHLKTSLCFVFE